MARKSPVIASVVLLAAALLAAAQARPANAQTSSASVTVNATSITSAPGSASSVTVAPWPSSGEAVTRMWGASYTQTGGAVSAANVSYDAAIGAGGGTVTFGFLASDSGQTPAPAAFYLNGNVCADD